METGLKQDVIKQQEKAEASLPEVAKESKPEIKTAEAGAPIATGVVKTALNVRSGAGKTFGKLGVFATGNSVAIYSVKGDWLEVAYGTQHGWVHKNYVDVSEGPSIQAGNEQAQAEANETPLAKLVKERGFKTNQELITYFINELGGGSFTQGAQASLKFGVSLNVLCNDRQGSALATAQGSSQTVNLSGIGTANQTESGNTKPPKENTTKPGEPAKGSKEIADFIRSNYPDGINVCFAYPLAGGNDNEFQAQATPYAEEYNTVGIVGNNLALKSFMVLKDKARLTNDINQISASVAHCLAENPVEGFDDSKCSKIKNLTIMCHGWVSEKGNMDAGGLSLSSGKYLQEKDIKGFVQDISGSISSDVRVQLYACNCARNKRQGNAGQQKEGDWYDRGNRSKTQETDTYANGDNSFADVLAEALGEDASVYGHTTRGHATGNYAARVYGKDAGGAQNGVSMFDIYFPQSFVAEQATRLGKDEVTIRTSMYTYYRDHFALDNKGRSSFIDPEGHGKRLRDGWLSEN